MRLEAIKLLIFSAQCAHRQNSPQAASGFIQDAIGLMDNYDLPTIENQTGRDERYELGNVYLVPLADYFKSINDDTNLHLSLEKSVQLFQAIAQDRFQDNARAWPRLGDAFWRLGEQDKAIAAYSRGIELHPNNAAAWYMRGRAHRLRSCCAEAIVDFTETLRLEKNSLKRYSLSSLIDRGKCRLSLGQIELALEDLEQASQLNQLERNESAVDELKMMKVQIAMSSKGVGEELTSILEEAYGENADNPIFINSVAWGIYEKTEAGELDDKALVTSSRKAAQKAADTAPAAAKGAILDTVAHLQFLEGDIESAMKTQAKAIEFANGDMKAELSEFLKTLQEAAKKADK